MIVALLAATALSVKPVSCSASSPASVSGDTNFFENELKKLRPGFALAVEQDFLPSIVAGIPKKSPDKPFSVVRDINKDGSSDAILLGVEDKIYKLIAVLSDRKGFHQVEIDSFGNIDPQKKWMTVADPKNMSVKKEYGIDIQFSVLDCKLSASERDLVIAVGSFSKPGIFHRLDKGGRSFNIIYSED
ncbi:MAG TPA: hypothetical protein VE954_34990 [Oligoflexus sp.]|uniref:hypothetical protein n=1 Tax=Oligoflexus sp. TaxID=1971216 RepID=UPI002D64ED4F|nr:hypothetical protein [Oligoflexus sp.]HYX38338.1 hypothetical protein [Oligoflexus sp.]